MKLIHFNFATVGRKRLFAREADRLAATRALIRVLGPWLLLFCIVDDHVHALVFGEPAHVAQLAGHLQLAFLALPGCPPLQATWFEEIEDRRHLMSMVPYVLRQTRHHDMPDHPAGWFASSFQDLVGARRLDPGAFARLTAHLPRLRLLQVWAAVEVTPQQPRDLAVLESCSPRDLGRLASRVHATPITSGRRLRPAVKARRLAIHLLASAGTSRASTASLLRTSPRTVRRRLAEPVDAGELDAALLQLAIERAVE